MPPYHIALKCKGNTLRFACFIVWNYCKKSGEELNNSAARGLKASQGKEEWAIE